MVGWNYPPGTTASDLRRFEGPDHTERWCADCVRDTEHEIVDSQCGGWGSWSRLRCCDCGNEIEDENIDEGYFEEGNR